MSLDKWKSQLIEIIRRDKGLPHACNLLRKVVLAKSKKNFEKSLRIIMPAYFKLYKEYTRTDDLKVWVKALNEYIKIIRLDACKIF